jgi:hypothetical protein
MQLKRFRRPIKPEIRIIGWDDTTHTRKTKTVTLVGIIFRGASFIDGMLSTQIRKDGTDATDKIAAAIRASRHYDQLGIIMMDGITFGGFNVVDTKKLYAATKLPVIAVQRKPPQMKEFKGAIRKLFEDRRLRLKAVEAAGKLYPFRRDARLFWYQRTGIGHRDAEAILKLTTVRGNVPEPVRVAHLIAGGLSGESRGRA